MNKPVSLIVFPATDMTKAKTLFTALLGGEPYADAPYYVGFRTGNVEIGLVPNAAAKGVSGPLCYWDVDDIEAAIESLVAAGAQKHQEPTAVAPGMRIAVLKDTAGNAIGLRESKAVA